ncbi:MAG: hypothetical protein JNL19_06820 [Burkholderiales bacterium]|nr:hypothetical protein [Burkholderiales bacterium]
MCALQHSAVDEPLDLYATRGLKAARMRCAGLMIAAASCLALLAEPVVAQTTLASPVRASPKKRYITDSGAYIAARLAAILEMRGSEEAQALGTQPRDQAVRVMEAHAAAAASTARAAGRAGSASIAAQTAVTNSSTWTEIGPAPIPNGQTEGTVTSVTGRVTAFEIDPTNNNRVYLGTANGGVWRSLNAGASWVPIFEGASSLAVGALALAPSDPTILYVGTGEANSSADSFAGVGLYRIDSAPTTATLVGPINPIRNYTDADGVTARSVPAFNGRSISKILVHPTDPGYLFVGVAGGVIGMGGDAPLGGTIPPLAMRGLYRLQGANGAPGSVTVQKLAVSTAAAAGGFDSPSTGNRNAADMIFPDPADPTTLVVWMNGTAVANDGGVFRSTNATAVTPTFTHAMVTGTASVRAMFAGYKQASAPTNVIYVATGESSAGTSCTSTSANQGALRVSTDGGVTWSGKLTGGGGFCGGQCFYNLGIDVRPGATAATSDDKLWLGGNVSSSGTNCQRLNGISTNGGSTFVNSATGLHADTHFIKVDPTNPNIVYHGNDGGVYKSTNGGSSWVSLNAGVGATEFQSIAVHPTDPKITIAGTQDNGTPMYSSAGAWTRVDYGDGGYARIDQSNTSTTTPTMYHTYYNQTNNLIGFARNTSIACASDGQWAFRGIYTGTVDPTVTCDGGQDRFNGITISDAVNFYAPLELGPSVVSGGPNTVYFGTDRLYRSTDRGDNMTVVSQGPIVSGVPIRSMHISRLNDGFRMVGLNNGQVWATLTGASTLTNVTGNLPTPLKQALRVVFDPNDATGNTAYVTTGGYWGNATGHIFRTTNLGSGSVTWSAVSGSGSTAIPDVPVNCLLVDPYDSRALYACTDIGVYYSADTGTTWNPMGSGMPRVPVFEMAFSAGTTGSRVLRAATHGRGMWEILPPAECVMDLDGNGVHDAKTDGLMILRAMLGFTGNAVTDGAIGANAIRNSWAEIQSVLNLAALDVDGNGVSSPHTDAMMLLRAMSGQTGNGVVAGATGSGTLSRPTWTAMRSYLNGRCSGSFAP